MKREPRIDAIIRHLERGQLAGVRADKTGDFIGGVAEQIATMRVAIDLALQEAKVLRGEG